MSESHIDALLTALALKDEIRTGWQLRGIEEPESVAAHSWGVALLALTYAEEAGVDPDAAVRLAILHDLPEAVTGDVATRVHETNQTVSAAEKHRREDAAVDRFEPLDVDLREVWETYEARDSDVSGFVKDMDMLDMCLQALHYERGGRYDKDKPNAAFDEYEDLDEFFATTEPRLSTDVGRRLYADVRERYERAKRE